MLTRIVAIAAAVTVLATASDAHAVYVIVRARNKTPNADLSAAQQAAAHSKKGDIIDIMADDSFPGGCSGELSRQPWLYHNGGPYVAVYLPGVSLTAAQKYIASKREGEAVKLYRIWSFLQDNLPAGVRNTLATTGCYQTTFPAIKSFIWDKVNGVSE
jgi:hypothetical protein